MVGRGRAARRGIAGLLAIVLLVGSGACGQPATWTPTPGATWTPTPGAAWTPAPGATWTPAPGAAWTPAPGATWTPTPGAAWTPTSGAAWTPTPGATWTPTPGPTASPAACRLFVLAGQSNMAGRGRYDTLPPGDHGALPANVRLVAVALDVHQRPLEGGFGPELGLARTLAAESTWLGPGETLLLVKYAVDASSLLDWAPDWDPAAAALTGHPEFGPLYDDLLALVARATAEGGAGEGCRPAAVLWMQGERDALFAEAGAAYEANLAALVRALRAGLGAPALPVLVGQVDPPADRYPAASAVRAAQAAVARTLPGVYLVDTGGLSRHADGLHYDTAGQLELGRRFARAYLDLP